MKVLVVSQYFWPESFRINDLVLGLGELGHNVTVLTGKPNYPGGAFYPGYGMFRRAREDYGGAKVVRVPMLPRGNGKNLALALNFLSFAASASLLAPILCRENYDVVLVYEPSPMTVGLPAVLLKKIRGTPVLFWVQDLWPESISAAGAIRSPVVLGIIEKLVRFIYKNCDRILIQSEAFRSSIEGRGVPRDRILYFPNSAESFYRPVILEHDAVERAVLPPGFRVMFAGNIGAAQDFGTILGAAEILRHQKDIHWVILGHGRMFPWVQEQVMRRCLTETVHLLGRHPTERMPRFFALADVMLVTLKNELTFSLTVPAKVQSYLACGKPIIAALNGEGARIVREARAGLASPAESPEGLANAVLRVYRMPESDRREMGLRGFQYFRTHFEREMLLKRLVEWMPETAGFRDPLN